MGILGTLGKVAKAAGKKEVESLKERAAERPIVRAVAPKFSKRQREKSSTKY